jgi:GTPase SAR1 family protein
LINSEIDLGRDKRDQNCQLRTAWRWSDWKSSMAFTIDFGSFPNEYTHTVHDLFSTSIEVNQQQVALLIIDTVFLNDWADLHHFPYDNADVFLICFSVLSQNFLENAQWWHKVHTKYPNKPIILVALKIDCREDPGMISKLKDKGLRILTKEDGLGISRKIEVVAYLECSSLRGLKNVFETNAQVAITHQEQMKKSTCNLL